MLTKTKTITIKLSTFKRLEKHAEPKVVAMDAIINEALDEFEKLTMGTTDPEKEHPESAMQIDPSEMPSFHAQKFSLPLLMESASTN